MTGESILAAIRRVTEDRLSLVEAALAYAHAGLHIFPLQARGKAPRHGTQGFHEATSDKETVRRWWTQFPNANIGCVPGRSGLLVIDIDGAEGQRTAQALGIAELATIAVRTGRADGGTHLWVKRPDTKVGNAGLGPHVDVRADSGYVVMPPSVHPSSSVYEWIRVAGTFASVDWDALRSASNACKRSRRTAEGSRNNSLTSYLGGLRHHGASSSELAEAASAFNAEQCEPPLPLSEVQRVVESISRYPAGPQDEADAIEALNQRYAVIRIGANARIMDTSDDDLVFMRKEEFRLLHSNKYVLRDGKQECLADAWLRSPARRQYDRIVFEPGELNTAPAFNWWRGWGVEPSSGDCSLFLDHIRDNICDSDEALYRWVVAWFAQIFQQPRRKPGTAIALRGRQGTGKTILGQVIGRLLGKSYTLVASSHRVTGQFNAHMERCLLLHADEAIWGGDVKSEGILKNLVTSDVHYVERKGIDAIVVPNYLRLLFTSNNEWVVPAGLEERRFCVIDVGEQRMQDKEYFGALMRQMSAGGCEALLDYLLKLDCSDVDLRSIPQTRALFEQKIATLTPEQSWWLDILDNGVLPGDRDGLGVAPRHLLFEHYIHHAQAIGRRRRSSETVVGTFLKKVVPALRRVSISYGRTGVAAYQMSELSTCRDTFAKLTRHPGDWGEPAKWQPDPHCSNPEDREGVDGEQEF